MEKTVEEVVEEVETTKEVVIVKEIETNKKITEEPTIKKSKLSNYEATRLANIRKNEEMLSIMLIK